MFKRLFGSSELEKLFQECRVDKSHEIMITRRIIDLASKYLAPPKGAGNNNVNINININNTLNNQINININNAPQKSGKVEESQNKRRELTSLILKKIRSSSDVLRIKGLVLAHSIIKKTYDQEFMEIVAEEVEKYLTSPCEKQEQVVNKSEPGCEQRKAENMQREFIHQNIISFYCQYLKKFILNIDTYRYAQRYLNGGRSQKQKQEIIEMVSQGFAILNLCNYILQSQYTFNKMGRYYFQHNQIVNLFIMYLSDLVVYNSYIKELSKISLKNIKQATPEQVRHHFLFVTQCQKTSDRLYQFFYNRYYYTQVKKMILMPTFLSIHTEDYNQLATYVKRNDPQLAQLVKNSKFSDGRTRSRAKTNVTELESLSTKLNKTEIVESKDFFNFMSFVQDQHKDLEDLTEVTVKKFTFPKCRES